MDLDLALQTFITESRELLADMEAALLAVEQVPDKSESVNAIFRAAHTIKGSAGLFSLGHIVSFTHGVESVLDRVRGGSLPVNDPLIGLLLRCNDHMCALIEALAAGQLEPVPALNHQGEPLSLALQALLAPAGTPAAPTPPLAPQAPPAPPTAPVSPAALAAPALLATDLAQLPAGAALTDAWHLSLRFGPEVLRNGMDPLNFIRYLQTLGRIVGITTRDEALPLDGPYDPEACYLGYEIALQTTADKQTLENVFEFVRDDCTLRLLPPHSRIAEYLQHLHQDNEPARLGEMLRHCGTLTSAELQQALAVQQADPGRPLGGILVEQGAVQPALVQAALAKQQQLRDTAVQESRSIRVDADKLDQLINLVGELIIAGANVNLIARRAQISDLQESTSKLSMLVEEVRDSALQLRMVKIGPTFSRFHRVVRDVSHELGKDIVLQVSGEDTELDKTVVEKIGDPLLHLVRNAMDHGIEPPAVRAARGKPAQGTLRLNACHDSGNIVITVQDDGAGLPRDRILAKALERGLVEPGHNLSDREVFALIFEPGFSTAEQITNLSGRGVGLDVVKRNITALRGTVDLHSEPGLGTTVTVRLPLTLAIIDGFLIGVGKSVFAIPLDLIEECIAYSAEPGHDYTNLRGEVLPFIRLRQVFGMPGTAARGENIVVLKHAGQKAGLVVDTLLGEFQTVIKPLSPLFSQVKCISGSTILGSGDVALILDVPALVRQAVQSAPSRQSEPLPV